MKFMSDETKAARTELRAARADQERDAAERAEGYRWWQTVPESEESCALNRRVIDAMEALPWWKRIDIDHTSSNYSARPDAQPEAQVDDADDDGM